MSMTISNAGIALIQRFEGLRLSAYLDAVGVPTIGYGHTRTAKMGQRISNDEAIDLLKQDLARFEQGVNSVVKVPINQNEFDALVSFAFNVGNDALRQSTLLRMLNVGQRQSAADQFPRWDYAGGRRLAGLTARRREERELFMQPVRAPVASESAQPWDPDSIAIDLPTLREPFPLSASTRVLRQFLWHSEADSLDKAVKQFQAEAGLTPDGIVGPATWKALLAVKERSE